MLEMKMSPAAKTFLVSGYPRNMRDVVEYADKVRRIAHPTNKYNENFRTSRSSIHFQISTVNGVILLSWKRTSLETQIEYGAKLGHVVLGLARMELNNFFRHVIPVADFYDQHKLLISVRASEFVHDVFREVHAWFVDVIS